MSSIEHCFHYGGLNCHKWRGGEPLPCTLGLSSRVARGLALDMQSQLRTGNINKLAFHGFDAATESCLSFKLNTDLGACSQDCIPRGSCTGLSV